MTEAEKILIYKKALALKEETDIDKIRSVSCDFFRKGGCPKVYSSTCKGCLDEDAVQICKETYLAFIFDRPQDYWTPEFEAPLKREKTVKSKEASSFAQKCDSCYASSHCSFYQARATCSIDFGVEDVDSSDSKAVLDFLIKVQMERLGRLQAFEVADGGMVDQNLSGEMDRLSGLVNAKKSLNTLRINQSAEIPMGDGGGGGGILSQIFGNKSSNNEQERKEIAGQTTEFIDAEIVEEPIKNRRRNEK